MPWASSTVRPTCRPSLLLEETSMLPLRDCWAHSPLKDIQYNLTHTHSLTHKYIHAYMSDSSTHSLIHREIKGYPPKLYRRISGSLRHSLGSFSVLRLFFSSPYFPFFRSSPQQISVLECCRRAGLNHPHFAVSVVVQIKECEHLAMSSFFDFFTLKLCETHKQQSAEYM